MSAWERSIRSEIMRFGGRGPRLSTPTRLPLVGTLHLAAPPVVICLYTVLRYLARVQMMTHVEVVLGRVLLGVVHTGPDAVTQMQRTFPRGGGVTVSVGRRFDDGSLNAFLTAALLRVVRDAVPVQAPASASVIPSAAVRGFDTVVSVGLIAGGAGRVGENAAACRVNVSARLQRTLLRVELLSVRS